MDFVKCPKCKRPILDRAKRCPGCGTPLGVKVAEGAAGSRGGRGGALGALLVVGLGATLFVAYVNGWWPAFGTGPSPLPPSPAKPTAREDTKFGLIEAERRDVYQEILRAEDHAQIEADRRYPPPDPSAPSDRWQRRADTREQFRRQADEEDKKAIAKRHGLTPEQLAAIGAEGVQGNWPRPPRQSLR